MNKLIILLSLIVTTSAFATVVKSDDVENKCKLYRVLSEEKPITEDEVVYLDGGTYGLSFIDMEVDFKNQNVTVKPIINVVLGVNRLLINDRAIISSKNADFKFLINQLNRKLYVFEKMCINKKNEVVYAKQFEATPPAENK